MYTWDERVSEARGIEERTDAKKDLMENLR